jgi:hypothetical protein
LQPARERRKNTSHFNARAVPMAYSLMKSTVS